jgi:hypothetical protein
MGRAAIKLLALCLCFWIGGCAVATQITNSPRSSTEQRLLVHALNRAFMGLDASRFVGKTVAVEFHGLTPDKDFAREFFVAWLHRHGARSAALSRPAQLHLKVFATVLAVDRGQSFFGTPSFTVPVLGFSVPEIPVFRNVRHLGYVEVKVSTTDAETGDFIAETPAAIGKAQHDDYTLFIVVHFTHSDLDNPRWDFGPVDTE